MVYYNLPITVLAIVLRYAVSLLHELLALFASLALDSVTSVGKLHGS